MKNILILFIVMFQMLFAFETNGQQVISSTGLEGSSTSGSISSTLGEVVIETHSAGSTTITQGFHQTKLSITGIEEIQGLQYTVSVSPNPAQDRVLIKITNYKAQKMSYTLFDINGKAVGNGKIENGQAEISFISFKPSTYIIKIIEKKKEIKTMKIIKE